MVQGRRHRFGSLVANLPTRPTPFLKWAGGKTQLLGQMGRWFPDDFEVYFEPFLGGGAVFFHLTPDKAVLGDSNEELMNVYRIVQNDVESLMGKLDKHKSRATESKYFYKIRSQDPRRLSDVSRAARMIFLNKTCYNGLYRVNSKGEFNVPFGRYKNPQLYDKDNLIACSRIFNKKLLEGMDYRDLTLYARQDDFVYLDPPYHPLSKTASFTSYTKNSFSETDQKELAEAFRKLDKRGCKVMLSNSATKLIRKLYKGFHIKVLKAKRAISCKGETRGAIDELLIMNYEV